MATEVSPEQTSASPTTKLRQAEGALGDVSGTCGARIARPERGIRERGEQRCDQRHQESEPYGIAHLPGGLPDQPIDAGAEHAAEAVKGELHRADGSVQRRPLPLFGWMRFRAGQKIA
jgi:hypothetical protein